MHMYIVNFYIYSAFENLYQNKSVCQGWNCVVSTRVFSINFLHHFLLLKFVPE